VNEPAQSPWLPFLQDLDQILALPTELHCSGGFAMVEAHRYSRTTADIDVISSIPTAGSDELLRLAGWGSELHRRSGLYLDFVKVAAVPDGYRDRLLELYSGRLTQIRVYALEAHDLALSKLERNFERDRADVEFLARTGLIQPETLRQRYHDELRPYVTGRVSWHDQTLQMWLQAYFNR
jgi:hypothetical protein